MKYIIITYLALMGSIPLFSKGFEGDYTMQGLLIDKSSNTPIKNAVLVINQDTLKTDDKGFFTYKVHWGTPCGFRLNYIQRIKHTKKMNPPVIILSYLNKKIKIKNKWRKYGLRQEKTGNIQPYHIKVYY